MGDARRGPGVFYETLVRTGIGRTTGSFRSGNQGTDPIAHTYENRKVEAFLTEPRVECDYGIASAYVDGPAAYMAQQVGGALEGEFQGISHCFYYGRKATFGNASAFPGLIDSVQEAMTVDAGGTTDNTATSVWLVRFGPQQVRWFIGNDGDLKFMDLGLHLLTDKNSKRYTGWVQAMVGRIGLQVGSVYSCARIKKITAHAGRRRPHAH